MNRFCRKFSPSLLSGCKDADFQGCVMFKGQHFEGSVIMLCRSRPQTRRSESLS